VSVAIPDLKTTMFVLGSVLEEVGSQAHLAGRGLAATVLLQRSFPEEADSGADLLHLVRHEAEERLTPEASAPPLNVCSHSLMGDALCAESGGDRSTLETTSGSETYIFFYPLLWVFE
jgi:hypothetical protein